MIILLVITIFVTIIGSTDIVIHFKIYKKGLEKTKKSSKLHIPFLSWHIDYLFNNLPCEYDGKGERIVLFGLMLYVVAILTINIFFIIYLVNPALFKVILWYKIDMSLWRIVDGVAYFFHKSRW